ncbi:MAG: hypothetical protein ACKVHP_22305 [Verrucomicrobiales bacterium]
MDGSAFVETPSFSIGDDLDGTLEIRIREALNGTIMGPSCLLC